MTRYNTHTVRARGNTSRIARRGYTLVEILVATTLTLVLMFAVVQIFAMIGDSVSDSRAILEMNDRVRAAKTRLQMDLGGLTVVPLPPRDEEGDGYVEIIEGEVMLPPSSGTLPTAVAENLDDGTPDTTVGDFDDVLMFTTRDTRTPFIRDDGTQTETDVAEVAWYVHGNRLYRRVRALPRDRTLTDLTRRENRTRLVTRAGGFPGLVTLPPLTPRDFWTREANNVEAGGFSIRTDEVILNNVIGFDVKVFDPVVGDYVDLGYAGHAWENRTSPFSHTGHSNSGLAGRRIYDTWSASYVDNPSAEYPNPIPPPYPAALRGIQVKIRVFEPDSGLIREVTVVQDFLPR